MDAQLLKPMLESIAGLDCYTGKDNSLSEKRRGLTKFLAYLKELGREKPPSDEGTILLGAGLMMLRESLESEPAVFGGLRLNPETIAAIDKQEHKILCAYAHLVLLRAKQLSNYATDFHSEINYLDRLKLMDRAILFLRNLLRRSGWKVETGLETDVHTAMARLYLDRSRMVLPKGEGFPPKKIEALVKAYQWSDSALVANPDAREALFVKACIAVEAGRHDGGSFTDKATLDNHVKKFLGLSSPADMKGEEYRYWEIVDYALTSEIIDKNHILVNQLLRRNIRDIKGPVHGRIKLMKARLAYFVDPTRGTEVTVRSINEIFSFLPALHFGDRLWDETTELIGKFRKEGRKQWRKLAIGCWSSCLQAETREDLRAAAEVHWYWPRLKYIYELALEAALEENDINTAIRVVDSLKSRPTLKEFMIEETLKGNERMLTLYYNFKSDQIIRQFTSTYEEFIKDANKIKLEKLPAPVNLNLPEDWAEVHLFLGSEASYCFYRGEDIQVYPIETALVDRAWEAFVRWDSTYRSVFGRSSWSDHLAELNAALDSLCLEIGKTLGFLFDCKAPNLLIIPHGFLHLVPIHGVKRDGQYLFEHKLVAYLPAASFGEKLRPPQTDDGTNALFVNLPSSTEKAVMADLLEKWAGYSKNNASPTDLLTYFKIVEEIDPPSFCAILCHGEANQANPYLSSLKLHESDLAHLKLREDRFQLRGTCVILGACETDMAPSVQGFTDEHLSLASAFLLKGVSSVAGNLWKVNPVHQKKVVEVMRSSRDRPFEVLRKQQLNWLEDYRKVDKKDKENMGPFFFLPFRVLGMPFHS